MEYILSVDTLLAVEAASEEEALAKAKDVLIEQVEDIEFVVEEQVDVL